jgi:hypothetical protein
MEMLKAKKLVFDTKALVTEINGLTREIDDLTARRDFLTHRYNSLENAADEWNSLTSHTASSAKQKLIPLRIKRAHHSGNGKTDNIELVTKTKELIASILTDQPMMPKAIMERLYATPDFVWPLSSQYLDLIIRNLARDGKINRVPMGYVKL